VRIKQDRELTEKCLKEKIVNEVKYGLLNYVFESDIPGYNSFNFLGRYQTFGRICYLYLQDEN
jgi:hypothetical protein